MGIDPANIEKSLDEASKRIFMFSHVEEEADMMFRFKAQKVKYRIVSQQKKEQPMSVGY